MATYVTFFNVGEDSEALVIDQLSVSDEFIIWDTKDEYFETRESEPEPIDGGVFTYGLAAGVSLAPDALLSSKIVSFRPDAALLDSLNALNSRIMALRTMDWPEWPEYEQEFTVEERTEEQIQDEAHRAVLATMSVLEAHWNVAEELIREHSSELDLHMEYLLGMDEPWWATNDHLMEAVNAIQDLLVDTHPTLEQREKFHAIFGHLDRFRDERRGRS